MLNLTRTTSYRILATLLALATLAGLSFDAGSQTRKRRPKTPRKPVLSAKDARAAVQKKVALRKKMSGLYGKMKQVRARIHKADAQAHQIGSGIHVVEARIGATRNRLARVQTRLRVLDRQHDLTVARLHATEDRLRKRQEMLGERLRENYQQGHTSYAHILLQSASLHEMLTRQHYVRRIVRSDTELIQGVKADIQEIATAKRQLEAQAREQEALGREFEADKARLTTDLARRQDMLHEVREKREQAADELDDLEAESEAMASRIRMLSEMLERRRRAVIAAAREAARRRRIAQQQARRRKGRPAPRSEPDMPDSPDFAPVWRGGFIRPIGARVTSGFGYRFHPILRRRRMHTGVDFGAPSGTPIRAAGDGTVLLAGYSGGYGNCVILDHGNGVTTLYGHCSAILVSEGQVVRQGQTIARVGSTGMSTGPHLHWEVRRNGVPVNPL